jgi:DNA-binding NtrC family response regulator
MSFKSFDALLDGASARGQREAAPRPTIVVIDDDADIRSALARVLGDRYTVVTCATALAGVQAVGDDVHVVIVDVKLQGLDGFWACNTIRTQYPDMPVIFYSAYQDLKDPYQIINEHRPFGYLIKDGDLGKLVQTVDTAARLHEIILSNSKTAKSADKTRP